MFKYILQIILLLVFIGLIILGLLKIEKVELEDWRGDSYEKFKTTFHPNKRILFALIPLGLWIGTMCIAVIPANTVGVKYSKIGGTSEKTLSEGVHLITPLDTIYEIDTTVQERTVKEVSVQTQDAQFVTMQINVKYQVSQSNAFKVYKGYKTLDNLNTNIIANYSQDALNEVCTQYNVIDLLGEKRNEIITKATEVLSNKFEVEGVTLKALVLKDIDAGAEIENAIKQEAVAKKAVETAEQNRLKAEKEAETKVIEAKGEADANAIESEKLTEQVLRKMLIEKWNGELPKVNGSNGNMFDFSGLIK